MSCLTGIAAPEHSRFLAEHHKLARPLSDGKVEHSVCCREFAHASYYFFYARGVAEHLDAVAQVLDPTAVGVGH